jgi:hypothetical protein
MLLIVLLGLMATPAAGQNACLDPAGLVHLDGQWEKALLESDTEFLRSVVAEDFIWVHDHASTVDTKAALLERSSNPSVGATGATRSRVSSEVKARILGSTGVVTGFTIVDRGPAPTRYNFMRTYVAIEDRCVLLANHTMAIPEN